MKNPTVYFAVLRNDSLESKPYWNKVAIFTEYQDALEISNKQKLYNIPVGKVEPTLILDSKVFVSVEEYEKHMGYIKRDLENKELERSNKYRRSLGWNEESLDEFKKRNK